MDARNDQVAKLNLIKVCRLSSKALIDRSSVGCVEEQSAEVINFLVCVECILKHRIKSRKSRIFSDEQRHFWGVLEETLGPKHPTISKVHSMGKNLSPIVKGRIWLRVVLMEKLLANILRELKADNRASRFYQGDSIFTSDDMNLLIGDFVGLKALDFSFCIKEPEKLDGTILVDYSPYLIFTRCEEGIQNDLQEKMELSGALTADLPKQSAASISQQLAAIQKAYRVANEQKGYLEELVQKSERETKALENRLAIMRDSQQEATHKYQMEIKQYEKVILELQHEISILNSQKNDLQSSITVLYHRCNNRIHSAISGTTPDDKSLQSDCSDELCLLDDTFSTRPRRGSLTSSGTSLIIRGSPLTPSRAGHTPSEHHRADNVNSMPQPS